MTYESICPESGLGDGGKMRIAGHSKWNAEGTYGTAVEQWTAIRASGSVYCTSTYDTTIVRQ